MANATITVLEADGTTETDVIVLDVGRQAAAASKSVTTATEDKAVLDAIAASLALLDNSIASGNELQVDIVGSLPAGTAAIGKVKVTNDAGTVIDPVAAGSAAMAASVPVTIATNDTQFAALLDKLAAQTSGDLSIFRSIDLDEGTLEQVKGSAGQIYACWVTNTATATRYVKFYNATSGTAGTGTPVITVGIPGNSADDISGHLTGGGYGIAFSTGICVGATTGVADNDTGAPGANEVIINVFYK